MWIMLNDAFFSIVKKDCTPDQLLVRARRAGDIEKVFGRRIAVERDETADYLYRARIPREEVDRAISGELRRIAYGNFKDAVQDKALHAAYLGVWHAMARVQNPPPYSKKRSKPTMIDDGMGGTFRPGVILTADDPRPKPKPPKGPRNPKKHGFTNGLWRIEELERQHRKAPPADLGRWDDEDGVTEEA